MVACVQMTSGMDLSHGQRDPLSYPDQAYQVPPALDGEQLPYKSTILRFSPFLWNSGQRTPDQQPEWERRMQVTLEVSGVGQALAAERAATRQKAYIVAGRAGIHPSTLARVEKGDLSCPPELAARIRRAIRGQVNG